jgi:hypothetical protein
MAGRLRSFHSLAMTGFVELGQYRQECDVDNVQNSVYLCQSKNTRSKTP